MKLSKKFVIRNSPQDSLLVPTGKAAFAGLVRGNKTLGAILELLKKTRQRPKSSKPCAPALTRRRP